MSSYRPSSLFTSSARLPPASGATGSPITHSNKNDDLANFLSTTGGSTSTSLRYGQNFSAPHFVTLEEFGQLRRQMEQDRNYRDSTIASMKTEITELRERLRVATTGAGGSSSSSVGGGAAPDPFTSMGGDEFRGVNSSSALMSSPPRTKSALSHHGLFHQLGTSNTSSYAEEASGGGSSSTILGRIERLEAFRLSLPAQLEAVDERVRTIADERSHGQLSGLIAEMSELSKRVAEVHEAAAAAQSGSDAASHELRSTAEALHRDMEQLHGFRLTSEDARVRLENDLRDLKAQFGSVRNSGQQQHELTEAVVDRRLALERDEVKELVRREAKKLRDEILDSHTQMRLELEDAKRVHAIRQAHLNDSEVLENNNNNSSSSRGATPGKARKNDSQGEEQDQGGDDGSGSSPSSLAVLRSQQLHHRNQDQLIESKLRALETQLSSQLSDTSRHLEAKLVTRVRELSEASRADVAERVDLQLDTVRQTLLEDLSHNLDGLVRRESEKLKRVATAAASSASHSRSNSNQQQHSINSNSHAPEIILDGVDLFLRELQLQNQPLFAQCMELILDVRQRGGPARTEDAVLLMWKFMRAQLGNSAVLTETVSELRAAVLEQQQSSFGGNSAPSSTEQQLEDSGIVANIVQDIDAMVAQFGGSHGHGGLDPFAPCSEYVEYCKNRGECSVANSMQLMWMFLRGALSTLGVLGARLDRVEKKLQ